MDSDLMAAQEINKGAKKEEDELKKEDQMIEFREDTWRTDFVIIVEGTRLHVAKNILSLASPVFDKMFQSDFREREKGEIEMPEKKLEDVKLFLQCIYPNTLNPITFETAMKILPLIEEYQVFQLKTACEKAILNDVNEDTSTESLYHVLNTACTYGLEFVRGKCVGLIANRSAQDSEQAKKKCPLPANVMNEILTLKLLDLETSNQNLKADISELQTNVIQLEETLEVMSAKSDLFKEYFARDELNTIPITLDYMRKWKANEVLMKVNPESLHTVCKVVVWDVKLAISTKRTLSNVIYSGYICLSVVIETLVDSFQPFNIKVKIVALNKEPKSSNLSCVVDGQIRPNNREVIGNVEKIPTNESEGFIKNGHIWLLIQLFMSEPNTH